MIGEIGGSDSLTQAIGFSTLFRLKLGIEEDFNHLGLMWGKVWCGVEQQAMIGCLFYKPETRFCSEQWTGKLESPQSLLPSLQFSPPCSPIFFTFFSHYGVWF